METKSNYIMNNMSEDIKMQDQALNSSITNEVKSSNTSWSNHIGIIRQIFRSPYYWFIAIDAGLSLGVFYWWLLSKTTTLTIFYSMYKNVTFYFMSYIILTFLSIVLFGINLAVLIYSWQHFRIKNFKQQGLNIFAVTSGAFAAACPICGSFLFSVLGIIGGVAILPLKGLELKLLSAIFFGLGLFLATKQLAKSMQCGECIIDSNEYSYQMPLAIFFIVIFLASYLFQKEKIAAGIDSKNSLFFSSNIVNTQKSKSSSSLYDEVVAKVLPKEGFQTKIIFGDAIVKLVQNGVIDPEKFKQIYQQRGMSEDEILSILTRPSDQPIKITADNAGLLVNLLWPLGLANKTEFNEKSPIRGESLFDFASTGGWTLGKEDNGGKYFNKFEIVKLTPQQEAIAYEVASNTYRPCCGNSTFFQDCNHGSALLGLIELGAAQGLSKEELYRVALQFNSFWFPETYIQTALYYKLVKNIDWENVDAAEIMSFDYSSAAGWEKNIGRPFREILKQNPDLLPQESSVGSCGV